jgi:lambda repressor-like predicted transcriptional regulator
LFSLDEKIVLATVLKTMATTSIGTKSDLERFAQEVRKRRHEKGWTLKELGARTGMSLKSISNVEWARNWPSMEKYMALCRALDCGTPPMMEGKK